MIPGPRRLERRVARRTARRLERLRDRLPEASLVLDALRADLARLPETIRTALLYGPDLRGGLREMEIWLEILRLADSVSTTGGDPRARPAAPTRLFDRVSRTEWLATLVPRGRTDPGFAPRCARLARLRLRQACQDLSALLVGLRIAHAGTGDIVLDLAFRSDPEQGRPAHRIDLGAIAGPAGALGIVAEGRGLGERPPGGRVCVRVNGGRVAFRATSAALRLARREVIPGTSILLAPALRSTPRSLTVARDVPGLGPRLARALRIVRLVWPEGYDEIVAQTRMVVPIREPGLVSYSLAARPGVSFINVAGKTLFDLADDLLHESAHHRLHAMQEVERYLARGSQTEEVQAFDSPWRGTQRPLHGVLHGAYTFRFRAELLRRALRFAARRRRLLAPLLRPRDALWLRRELRREEAMLSRATAELWRAGRDGLLTRAGRRLVAALRSRPRAPRGGKKHGA